MEILLVEDNPGDVLLTREALADFGVPTNLSVVGDGEQAMAFLRREGNHSHEAHPDLILLDLNLPKKDGREVLAEVKSDEDLRRIPVVVLTTSDAEEDVQNVYGLHANSYITKPVEADKFDHAIKSIQKFWLGSVRLPRH